MSLSDVCDIRAGMHVIVRSELSLLDAVSGALKSWSGRGVELRVALESGNHTLERIVTALDTTPARTCYWVSIKPT